MPIPKLTYQLLLELDLPAPEDDGGIGPEEARQRSEIAQKTLEFMFGKAGMPLWF